MEDRDIKITANSSEEFSEIEKLLLELPEIILSQISTAEFGSVGLHCFFKNNDQKIFLPNTVTQITYFEDRNDDKESYTGIYWEGDDDLSPHFFFKLDKNLSDKRPTFVFIDIKVEKEKENLMSTKN
jgi:hypothetical protein